MTKFKFLQKLFKKKEKERPSTSKDYPCVNYPSSTIHSDLSSYSTPSHDNSPSTDYGGGSFGGGGASSSWDSSSSDSGSSDSGSSSCD